jgi:CubicO group peptidase (beta-lactamase class C family)
MMGVGPAGAFGWPGIYGTSWQADPSTDTILIYWVQNSSTIGGDSSPPSGPSDDGSAARWRSWTARPRFKRQSTLLMQPEMCRKAPQLKFGGVDWNTADEELKFDRFLNNTASFHADA